jgi:hypothetical protein
MSYANPFIPVLSNLKGIDKSIEEMRVSVSSLPFIQKAFGRAYIQRTDDDAKIEYPAVYTEKKEYYNAMPNDNLLGQSFFKVNQPIKVDEYGKTGSSFEAELSLIFWGNLQKIDGSKDFIFTSELIDKTIAKLQKTSCFMELVEVVDEDAEEVFKGFSLRGTEKHCLMYPYTGFRITFKIGYFQECYN